MALTPIIELGVAAAYDFLVGRFGLVDLPPLEAIEHEDWGRDYLLSRFLEVPAAALAEAGLTWEEGDAERGPGGPPPIENCEEDLSFRDPRD